MLEHGSRMIRAPVRWFVDIVVASIVVLAMLACSTGRIGANRLPSTGIDDAWAGGGANRGLGVSDGHRASGGTDDVPSGAQTRPSKIDALGHVADRSRRVVERRAAAVLGATTSRSAGTVVIFVVNSNGSMTPVTLRRRGNVYVGPMGEWYGAPPIQEQLKPVYGF